MAAQLTEAARYAVTKYHTFAGRGRDVIYGFGVSNVLGYCNAR